MAKLRIAFSGTGAMGGCYGGMVAARYQGIIKADTFFIARGENLGVIHEESLQMQLGIRATHTTPALATDNPAKIGPVDYLFCCTKSCDPEENIQQSKPVIGPKAVIIPLLSGLDIEERIRNILPGQEVRKGCVYISSRLTEPGVVEKFSLKERTFFGSKDASRGKRIESLELLMYVRLSAFNPADIDLHVWKEFFVVSTAATATSLLNRSIDEVLAQRIDLLITLDIELKNTAEAMGVSSPDDIVCTSIETQKMMPAGSTTPMYNNFLTGKKAELETLIGYIIRRAEKLGVDVPTYRFVYNGLPFYSYPRNQ